MKYVTISVSQKIKNLLKIKCATINRDIRSVVEELIMGYLEASEYGKQQQENHRTDENL